ncbi:MAG: glycoside hydrolase family 44 protein [Myxococcales bacterium]|nr:glycoside hydrolase family 44 protein [Myxococcales bacterium]
MRPLCATFAVLLALTCAAQAPPAAGKAPAPKVAQLIYDSGLQGAWEDFGWARRDRRLGGPERLDFSEHAGWILANRKLAGSFGGLVFRLRAPPAHGDFLQVRADSEVADIFPRVKVGSQHRRDLGGGWTEVFVAMKELNPTGAAFDKVVFRAWADVSSAWVEIDGVALTVADAAAPPEVKPGGTPAAFSVDCSKPTHQISPLIYGIAFNAMREYQSDRQWKLGATARRWGGNTTSRYNWKLGNAWNTGADWYFRNVNSTGRDGFTWRDFFTANAAHGVRTALTVPTLGWVAKDTSSFSFSTEAYGPQQSVDPDRPKAGNGLSAAGRPLEPPAPATTSVEAPPKFVADWLEAIAKEGRSADLVILDNEPMLWSDTHRDVHPLPTTYDELLERTVQYGSAVRKAAPRALIAGPALWGWPAYFHSAQDSAVGLSLRPDRRRHADEPLITWYLKQLAAHEKKTGVRLLDVVDVHFYPQGKGLGLGEGGATDADTNARRIRSTRALWDPTYRDESWIDENVQLIPRMKEWVRSSYPGLKVAIGEYNFGAEKHPSGGLALAEALGRFGREDLYAAFYWTYPPESSPAFWAFRAYRDYDGQGARFLDLSLPTGAPEGASLFAARDQAQSKATLVLLNFSPTGALEGAVTLKGCPAVASQRVFSFAGDPKGFAPVAVQAGKPVPLPPYSITVVELSFAPAKE